MKNKRLSNGDRNTLTAFAKQQIEATEDKSAYEAAYERAATAIHEVVVAMHPQKDMQILAKYDCASPDPCIYVSTGGYNYERFEYVSGDKRIAQRPLRNCRTQTIVLEGEAEEAFDAWRAAKKALEDGRKQRLNDFRALILNSRSFNQVAETWPAAERLRETIVGAGTALVTLSDEVVDRLKSDAAFQIAA